MCTGIPAVKQPRFESPVATFGSSPKYETKGGGLAPPRRGPRRAPELGVGIAGLRERVQQLNGAFEVPSAADKGTIVHATLRFTARTPRKDLLHGE